MAFILSRPQCVKHCWESSWRFKCLWMHVGDRHNHVGQVAKVLLCCYVLSYFCQCMLVGASGPKAIKQKLWTWELCYLLLLSNDSKIRFTWQAHLFHEGGVWLGSITTNHKNGLTGEQLVVGTDSRAVSTGSSRMFSVFTEGCHVGYYWEFVGRVYCTHGQSNTTIVRLFIIKCRTGTGSLVNSLALGTAINL